MKVEVQVRQRLAALPAGARVLDVGGWFNPLNEATDVVDLLPYETRRTVLTLAPLPGERFTRERWHQADFLAPNLRLPFADGEFDFIYCGHTVEDLAQPAPLLREMQRVGRAGAVVSPSRLAEQTVGVRDRVASRPGHPHHHWIVDPLPAGLRLSAKADSLGGRAALIPLRHFERLTDEGRGEFAFWWAGSFEVGFESGGEAAARAVAFARAQRVRPLDRALDPIVRRMRGWKHRLRAGAVPPAAASWAQILDLSRPYSRLPLPRL